MVITMVKLTEYNEKYDTRLRKLDPVTYYTIKYHSDVITESVCAAIDGNKLIGVGFLKSGATFLKVDKLDLPCYFIHAEHIEDEKADPEKQIIASELILERLKTVFGDIQEKHTGKRLILRLWCDAKRIVYEEFLMMHGFRPMRIIPVLVRELTKEDERYYESSRKTITMNDGEELRIEEMNPNDDSFMEAYTVTNREAFEVEDSENELKFVMQGEDSHVFAVMKEKRVIAAVTLWRISGERAATENIFCAADYRRKGVTSQLLKYVFGFLKSRGYEQASLTVFGDNQPAAQLYFKLGYEVESNFLELHYEGL